MQVYSGVTVSSATASAPIVVYGPTSTQLGQDNALIISNLGLICTATGTLTYSVQVTADPPSNIVHWNNHDTMVNLTASANGNIAYAVTAVRLNVTAFTSGSVNLGMAQWP